MFKYLRKAISQVVSHFSVTNIFKTPIDVFVYSKSPDQTCDLVFIHKRIKYHKVI